MFHKHSFFFSFLLSLQANSDLHEVTTEAQDGDMAITATSTADNDDDTNDDDVEEENEDENEDYYNMLKVNNTSLMLGLLESIFILWTLIRPELVKVTPTVIGVDDHSSIVSMPRLGSSVVRMSDS